MRRIYLSLFLCLLSFVGFGQTAASYSFERTTGTYNSIAGLTGTVATGSISSDDNTLTSIPIGFSFSYCGNPYTQLSMCSNGYVSLANSGTADWSNGNMGEVGGGVGFLSAYWDDLFGNSSTAYYQLSGTAPNRVFTLQWGSPSAGWGNYSGGGTATFQIKLYEGTNAVQFCYGSPGFASGSATIGIANSGSDFQNLSTSASTTTSTSFSAGCNGSPSANTILTWTLCTDPPASTISGSMCVGGSSTLSNSVSGGTWSTGNAAVATVNTTTGVVSGVSAGTARITYTVVGGCNSNVIVTVNPKPTVASITPSVTSLCIGSPVTFTAGTASGIGTLVSYNWSGPSGYTSTTSTPTTTYTTTSTANSGVYSLTVTYSVSGCTSAAAVITPAITVNDVPSAISGTASVCIGGSQTLSSSPTGGTWASGNTTVASVVAGSGSVTGLSDGLALISYTAPTGCVRTRTMTVNPLPVLNISPASATICLTETTSFSASSPNPEFTLLGQNFNSGLMGWTVTNTSGDASGVSYWQIVTPPGAYSVNGDGTAMLQSAPIASGAVTNTTVTSPSFTTQGGYGAITLTFNQFLFTPGATAVLVEYSVNGGAWQILADQTTPGAIGADSWSASTPETTIPLPPDAIGVANLRLRWSLNSAVVYWFLDNIYVKGTLPPSTFDWSGAFGLSCTACATADMTPIASGANVYSVTATSSQGCTTTNAVTVNANPLPATISGSLTICENNVGTLTSTPGGTWVSGNTSIATIEATTGIISALATGTTSITYTLPTGCVTTRVVTVVPAPTAITGNGAVCQGLTTLQSNASIGGSWSSSNTAVAGISATGLLSGVTAGTTNISYTLPSGCTILREVTVNALPPAIAGIQTVCKDATVAFSNPTSGGTWSTADASVATIDGTGTITGVSPGNTTITYTLPTTCIATRTITVNSLPSATSGPSVMCQGTSIVLTNVTPGGSWSSSSAGVASVDATSGVVTTGGLTGDVTINYTLSSTGCSIGHPLTVNPTPAAITTAGAFEVCRNGSISFSSASAGGTWSTNAPGTLSVVAATGVATGNNAGNATVTYTLPTTCRTTAGVVVNPLPASIAGPTQLCEGETITLSNTTTGGVWVSTNTSVATVSSTGLVSGVMSGTSTIIYTLPTGCSRQTTITVNGLPSVIGGVAQVCVGSTTVLGSSPAGGNWTSSNSSVASIATSGVVTGIVAGTTNITYTLPTGCIRTQAIVVNSLPAVISGGSTVCEGQTITLGNTLTGGVWASTDLAVANVDGAGVVSGIMAGTTTISYTMPLTGCSRNRVITVYPTPTAIAGSLEVCRGLTTVLGSTPTNGVWTSGTTSVATISSTGVVTGIAAGNSTITYTLPEGCSTTANFTVNPLPAAITGTRSVCENGTTTLSNTSTGGTWSSSVSAIASIDASTGVVTGLVAGTTTITYELPTTCMRTAVVTVNALPSAISGATEVCQGLSTVLSNSTTGGSWISSATSTATVNTAGVVTGIADGAATITYRLVSTGCQVTASMQVNPLPADITGTAVVCRDQTTTLSNGTTGGNWTSGTTAVATIDATGMVTGNAAGTAIITYALPTGCQKTRTVVVNPLPAAISGVSTICQNSVTMFGNASGGGSWSSSDNTVATIASGTGVATGISAGFSIITYALPTGCIRTTSLVVNSLPESITGVLEVCAGQTTTLESATGGGTWASATSIATINAAGVVNGIAAGTTRITYTAANSCSRTAVVTVNALPSLIGGPTAVCPGLTVVQTNENPLGTWTSANPSILNINSGNGISTGVIEGTTTVTYTLPTGCYRSKSVTVHPAVAAVSGSTSVCAGGSTTLSNTSTGGVWISGNTAVATIDVISGLLNGVSAGVASVTYTLPTGCIATQTMVVNALPAAITGATAVCAGATATVSNTTAGGSWSSSDAAIVTIDGTGTISGITAGSATIRYELPTGCSSSRTIVVNALPTVDTVTGGGSYCAGGAGVAVGLSNSQIGTTYTLTNGSSTMVSLTGTGAAITFGAQTLAGVYEVSAVTTLGCGTTMNGSATVAINPLVTPSVSVVSALGNRVCAGTSTTFTATGTNGGTTPTYSWTVNGTPVATTATYAFVPANGDEVKVTYTSSEVCASPVSVSAMINMTVVENLTPSVSITVSPNDTVCQGSTVTFSATATNGGATPAYSWIVGGALVPTATSSSYSYMPINGQTVICKLNSSYECALANDVSSNTITMRVEDLFIPEVDIVANPGTVVVEGTEVTFTTTVANAGPAPKYQWLINNEDVAGATSSTFSYNNFADGDSLTCIVTGTGECGLSTINSVVMKVTPTNGIGSTGTIGGDIRLVPNPNTGKFVLSGTIGNSNAPINVEVTNMLGQVVYSSSVTAKGGVINERIELNNTLANGMYLLNLNNGSDRKVFHFVVKQ